MSKKITLLYILSLVAIFVAAQEKDIHFSIRYSGKETGRIVASHKQNDTNETYNISGEAFVNLWITKYVLKNTQHSVYENEYLKYSHAENSKNGETEKTTETQKQEKFYIIKSTAGHNSLQKNIAFSVGKLYFHEPVGLKEIYSEVWGQMVPVSQNGNHTYTLHLPNGKESTYNYVQGELQSVKTETIVGSVYFVRTGTAMGELAENHKQ